MSGINVGSETGRLRRVMLHRPGRELLNLTPDTLGDLLFDDIPFLKGAREEHDLFAQALRDAGAEVVYLEDLAAEALDSDPGARASFLADFVAESGIAGPFMRDAVTDFLDGAFPSNRDLVLKTMEGVYAGDVSVRPGALATLVGGEPVMLTAPMPNLYFTRDPFASIGRGVAVNRMFARARRRETLYARYVFDFHPSYRGVPRFYGREEPFSIEGGDILNLSERIVAVGISQRTEAAGVEALAARLFASPESPVDTVLAFDIPKERAFMHLDTVFTQIDRGLFTVHPRILDTLRTFELTGAAGGGCRVREVSGTLAEVLSRYLGEPAELLPCARGDRIASEREQWNDGSNTLCVSPGTVVVYDRNDVTNDLLRERGVHVVEIRSGEISRGRGGPRCMSMPLVRD